MNTESRAPFRTDEPPDDEGIAPAALVQSYRCPEGHLSDIVWTVAEIVLAREVSDVTFYCPRCKASRYASDAQAASLLAAFGLAPGLRIYSS